MYVYIGTNFQIDGHLSKFNHTHTGASLDIHKLITSWIEALESWMITSTLRQTRSLLMFESWADEVATVYTLPWILVWFHNLKSTLPGSKNRKTNEYHSLTHTSSCQRPLDNLVVYFKLIKEAYHRDGKIKITLTCFGCLSSLRDLWTRNKINFESSTCFSLTWSLWSQIEMKLGSFLSFGDCRRAPVGWRHTHTHTQLVSNSHLTLPTTPFLEMLV